MLILRDGKWIISSFKFTATNEDGFEWRKEIKTSTYFFHCDENVETYESFWEINLLFTRFGSAAAQTVLNIDAHVSHDGWLKNDPKVRT